MTRLSKSKSSSIFYALIPFLLVLSFLLLNMTFFSTTLSRLSMLLFIVSLTISGFSSETLAVMLLVDSEEF